MDVSPNVLRKETVATLKAVNNELELGNRSDPDYATLLLAKSQCLNTLTLLRQK